MYGSWPKPGACADGGGYHVSAGGGSLRPGGVTPPAGSTSSCSSLMGRAYQRASEIDAFSGEGVADDLDVLVAATAEVDEHDLVVAHGGSELAQVGEGVGRL